MNKKINNLAVFLLLQQGFIPINGESWPFDLKNSDNPRLFKAYRDAKQILRYLKIKTT